MTTPPHQNMDPGMDFMSGGIKSCSFKGTPPISHSGEILEIRKEQQRDYDDGTPLTWDDGNPKMQFVFKIQTDKRDTLADPDDDGVRGLYLASPRAIAAVREAVKAAGGARPEVGGRVTLTYISDDVANQRGAKFNPPKNYSATYVPPGPENAWAAVPTTAAAAPASAAPAQPPLPPAADPNIAILIQNGIDAAKVMAMDTGTRALVAATFG